MSRHVQVRLPEDYVDYFDERFPIHGAKQWFLEACFKMAVDKLRSGEVEPPVNLVTSVVKEATDVL